jgi:UDP-N-acetylglucosamine 2-epimerase (non-hydrolysing)
LLQAIAEISNKIPVIFPVHPRTKERLSAAAANSLAGIRFVAPLGYLDFLSLMSRARLVLTDSGGIQEETTSLGVPCLTLRENTERPVTVTEGTNELVGQDPKKIIEAANKILKGETKKGRIPRYWDGKASERIIDILLRESRTAGVPAGTLRP